MHSGSWVEVVDRKESRQDGNIEKGQLLIPKVIHVSKTRVVNWEYNVKKELRVAVACRKERVKTDGEKVWHKETK